MVLHLILPGFILVVLGIILLGIPMFSPIGFLVVVVGLILIGVGILTLV
jgi:uncharacterized membrane protein HdeD (DUF308 family)